jgi:hypothetical protein
MKNVVIVGNGKSALNNQNGKEIDSFDIVVRLNRFKTIGFENHVGSKTDVVAVNEQCFNWLLQTEDEYYAEYERRHKLFLKENSINLQNFDKNQIQLGFYKNYFFKKPDLKNIKNILILFSNKDIIPKTLLEKCLFPTILQKFSIGYLSILYYLEQSYKVTITGFDSYQNSSCYWSHNDKFFTEEFLINKRTGKFTDGHPYELENINIKKLIFTKKIRKLE